MVKAGAMRRSRAFTLVELMIVITIIAILAAVAMPLVGNYITDANQAAAEANLSAAEKAVTLYFSENGSYPAELTPDLFRTVGTPTMPDGWVLNYDPATGVVELAQAGP